MAAFERLQRLTPAARNPTADTLAAFVSGRLA
jgi:hypothetical protein